MFYLLNNVFWYNYCFIKINYYLCSVTTQSVNDLANDFVHPIVLPKDTCLTYEVGFFYVLFLYSAYFFLKPYLSCLSTENDVISNKFGLSSLSITTKFISSYQ